MTAGFDAHGDHRRREVVREAMTMALYVAVCLLAALSALDESADHGHVRVLGIIWGTAIGLVLAHIYAFRMSTRLVAAGEVPRADRELALSQVVGAAFVALLCTIPVVVLAPTSELDTVRLLLAGFIATVAFLVARSSGASTFRSAVYAAISLVIGVAIAIAKNVLSGH
jgi:hypothetical protein